MKWNRRGWWCTTSFQCYHQRLAFGWLERSPCNICTRALQTNDQVYIPHKYTYEQENWSDQGLPLCLPLSHALQLFLTLKLNSGVASMTLVSRSEILCKEHNWMNILNHIAVQKRPHCNNRQLTSMVPLPLVLDKQEVYASFEEALKKLADTKWVAGYSKIAL